MSNTTTIRVAEMADLKKAHAGSFYFIAGAGGDLSEWVSGYEEMLEEQGIGKPTEWLSASGAAINLFANQKKGRIVSQDQFPLDITCLLFPHTGLNMAKLPLFKLRMEDRWFDDVIDNMRRDS